MGGKGDPLLLSRRGLLRLGALAVVAGPAVAACTSTPSPGAPDPLLPMLNLATTDAATAKAAATAFADNGATLTVIATVRGQQAAALRTEVDRAAGIGASTTPPASTSGAPKLADEPTVTAQLMHDLDTARQQAAGVVAGVPRYRAGLVGSVAAGCASLAEALRGTPITTTSATSANPAPSGGSPTLNGPTSNGPASESGSATMGPTSSGGLATDTAQALQAALGAEYAAFWLYGTVSAFVGGGIAPEIIAGMAAVQNLRDATAQRLTAGQVTPQPPQPAYLAPKPITDQPSALVNLAIAESDATVAWRSVLEHTDEGTLRSAALAALVDSAVRETRWRRLAGESPASVAMPGTSA